MSKSINPDPLLNSFPLGEVGEQIVQMLIAAGMENPAVLITVNDLDTGEAMTSCNLEEPFVLELLEMLAAAHRAKQYDLEVSSKDTMQ